MTSGRKLTGDEAKTRAKAYAAQRKKQERRRSLVGGGLVLLAIAVAAVAFTGYQALQARTELNTAAAGLERISTAVRAGDVQQARSRVGEVQDATSAALDHTNGPLWWIAAQMPVVGDDIDAVRTIAGVGDGLSREVLPPLLEVSATLDPSELQPRKGRIALEPIEKAVPDVRASDRAMQAQLEQTLALEPDNYISRVAAPVRQVQDQLTEAAGLTGTAARTVQLMPAMLGADSPRRYLLMFQNNAEVRATGGIPGAVAVITADQGRIKLVEQGTATDIGRFDEPVLPLSRGEQALFGPNLTAKAADVTFTPDFPRTAEIVQEMWERSHGEALDGVLSADPVALSYILRGTGPVSVGDTGQQLTAGNAVQLLLNDVYLTVEDPAAQDDFFASAAQSAFQAVADGQGDPETVIRGLSQGVEEGRIFLWSDSLTEQELLASTRAAGALNDDDDDPDVGVYLNDGTGAKLSYYLDYDVQVQSFTCSDAGQQELRVTTTMRSTAPADATTSLPSSILGNNVQGVPPGVVSTNIMLYAPLQSEIAETRLDGKKIGFFQTKHDGRPVAGLTLYLKPGQEREVIYDVVTAEEQEGAVDLRMTPGVRSTAQGLAGPSACS